jgi:rod shape-determining protein MreD
VAVLQTTVGPAISVLGVAPDAVLVVVVCRGLIRGSEQGMVWGFLGGVALGLLSGAPFGGHALLLTVIGAAAGVGRLNPFSSQIFVPILAICASTLAYVVGMVVMVRGIGGPAVSVPTLAGIVAPAMITNAILGVLCYWALHALLQRTGLRSEF